MPEQNPPPTLDRPAHSPVWETGVTPGEPRTPGGRRLWACGLIAVAVFSSSALAISLLDKNTDGPSPGSAGDTAVALSGPDGLGFSLPATPVAAPSGKSGMTSVRSSASADGSASASPGTPTAGSGSAAHPSKGGALSSGTSTTWRSVRSVNYPDRYWQVNGDIVRLDPAGSASARRAATFKQVKGLADDSCYSFATADGTYLRHRDFVLRAETDDRSALFEQDATFCPRASSYPGAIMLESVNYPGRFLRHQNFRLELDPYQNSDLYRADSAFRLVDGLS
ncbi:AbfB domain-containing protein [Streptomyces sp. NPDC052036]|uniref:AbfB domain-containing protein n=1 Tax=Streptomyces sp. NPDC052036 TaxID=3155171 RepID=UPI0034351480